MRLENELPNEQTENGKAINENRKLVYGDCERR